MNARANNLRVERAAVAATELSLSRCGGLYPALPVVDHGTDLLVYQVEPFRVAKVQVKGATRGLKVFRQYAASPMMIVSYVLDPLGDADVVLLTGEQAWNLPTDYACWGRAAHTRGGRSTRSTSGRSRWCKGKAPLHHRPRPEPAIADRLPASRLGSS